MDLKKFATRKNASKAVAMVLSSGLNYGTVNMALADEAVLHVPAEQPVTALAAEETARRTPLYVIE